MEEHEADELVLLDVDAHVLCNELIGADGVAVGADFGIVQDKVHQQEGETGQDDVAGRAGEEAQVLGQGLLDAARDKDRDALEDQHQADRDDHGRHVQAVVEHADQETDQGAAAEAAEDKAGIAVLLRQDDADDGGQYDIRADRKVEQAHDDDEIEAAAADRIDDGRLKIGIQIAEGAEV